MYFDDPLVKVSAIDRAGNKVQTSFKNNNSQRVFYHFKAPANQFYVEPLTPYLYREKNDSLEVKANGQCGQIYYQPMVDEKATQLVKWKMEKINPIDPLEVKDLEFEIYSQQDTDLNMVYSLAI